MLLLYRIVRVKDKRHRGGGQRRARSGRSHMRQAAGDGHGVG
jgi:hypothetical protein